MTTVATTKLSSKGQVVIPELIRRRLGLETGAQFVVLGEGDTVILKAIAPPDRREVLAVLKRARVEAKRAGLKPRDVKAAIREARGKK